MRALHDTQAQEHQKCGQHGDGAILLFAIDRALDMASEVHCDQSHSGAGGLYLRRVVTRRCKALMRSSSGGGTSRFCCGFCVLSSERDHLLSSRRYLQRVGRGRGGDLWGKTEERLPRDAAGESGLSDLGRQRGSSCALLQLGSDSDGVTHERRADESEREHGR